MAALGTGVLGAPFSMICLALELTGDFSVTVGAVVAASVSAMIVRELFGYSFATWRFHLRGEVIRGPQDIGWVKQISAATLMRSDFETAQASLPIAEAQKLFPPGRVKQVVLRQTDGSYGGMVEARRSCTSALIARRSDASTVSRISATNFCCRTSPSATSSPRSIAARPTCWRWSNNADDRLTDRHRQRSPCAAHLRDRTRAAQSGSVLPLIAVRLRAAGPCRSG